MPYLWRVESGARLFCDQLFRVFLCDDNFFGASMYATKQKRKEYDSLVRRNRLLDGGIIHEIQRDVAVPLVAARWFGQYNIATSYAERE
mmetsp:Transcript_9218/g.22897  ORF Transcript_9218/g.22897 Transcript_9218/m.22897 type:complete len:89 (-) Transcript_9218:301-567(-)